MGAHITEQKNKDYIQAVTSDHVEILDPTGRAAMVHPSQVTDLPDHSFGLGHSNRIDPKRMKGITDKIRQKLKLEENDFGEFQRLVNAVALEDRGSAGSTQDEDLSLMTKKIERPGTSVNVSMVNNLTHENVTSIDASGSGDKSDDRLVDGSHYLIRALSKFELDCLQRKKEEKRRRIEEGQTQTAAGRIFSGTGFVSKPKEIIIKDFVPGKKYIRRFTLTNASYTFNSFKLLPIDTSLADFLSVSYERLGRMSAGVSCTIELCFTPQVDEDINTLLHFHSETGPGSVAIKCIKRRCEAKLLEERIDFGHRVIGNFISKAITVVNPECLGTRFSVEKLSKEYDAIQPSSFSIDESNEAENKDGLSEPVISPGVELRQRVAEITTAIIEKKRKEQPVTIACSLKEGYIDGYSNLEISFSFCPLEAGTFEETFLITFLDSPEGKPFTSQLKVCGMSEESPIYMEIKELQFGCTYLDKIYRNSFEIRNRGGVSKKVEFLGGNAIADLIEITPAIAIIQPFDSIHFSIKFHPNALNLQSIQQFMAPIPRLECASLMVLPLRMDVSIKYSKLFNDNCD